MPWSGLPPEDKKSSGSKMLRPGTYEATIQKVVSTNTYGEQVEITYEVEGQGTIRQWIAAGLEPDEKGRWVFFKLMGALDFPNEEYYDEDKKSDREPRDWDPLQDLRDCSDAGKTLLLTIKEYTKKDGSRGVSVDSTKLASPRRNQGLAEQSGPAAEPEAQGFHSDDHVPF